MEGGVCGGNMAMMVKILPVLPILPDNPPSTSKVAGGGCALCISAGGWECGHEQPSMCSVADLCAHLPPLCVSLGIGGRMVLCVLVCVTLNLSLHVFVSQPLPWICVQESCPWEGL